MSAEPRTPAQAPSLPWFTAVCVIGAAAATAWPSPTLLFAREQILRGELWRLWTGHLVHFSWSHFAWDAAVLAVAGGWSERLAPRRTRVLYVLAPVVIGVAVLAFEPTLQIYGGLSGVAAACVALLALTGLTRPDRADRWFWVTILALLGAKLLVDALSRQPVLAHFRLGTVRTVPVAHLAGVFAALALHARSLRRRRRAGK